MLRAFAAVGAGSLLFVSPLARAAEPLPPPPPPPPGYQAPVRHQKPPRELQKPPPPPPTPAPAPDRTPSPSPPQRAPDDGEVAVHLHSDQPLAHYQLLDPDFPDPIASCTGSCTVYVAPGRYRLHVSATGNTRAGTSIVHIERASRLDVSPRGYSGRWIGLGTAIVGMGGMLAGVALLSSGGNNISDSRLFAGVGAFMAGAALTPIGWVVFGKSFRPSVRVLPERTGDSDATARLGLGLGVLTFSARF